MLYARFIHYSLEEWIFEELRYLQTLLRSYVRQLEKARLTCDPYDYVKVIKLSEKIGEHCAEEVIISRFPSAKIIHRGSGPGTFDLIFRLSNGSIVIVEAKGGSGKLNDKEIRPGVRAQQGTVSYLRSVLDSMKSRPADQVISRKVLDALNGRRIRYFLIRTPIPQGSGKLVTILQEFRLH